MISILGSILGFGTSFLPKVLKSVDDKAERKHQLELIRLQAELRSQGLLVEASKAESDAEAQVAVAEATAAYDHDKALDGGSFVNKLRASVRPVLTYTFFALFLIIKITALIISLNDGENAATAINQLWDIETQALFAAIVSFWFGNRAVSHFYKKDKDKPILTVKSVK